MGKAKSNRKCFSCGKTILAPYWFCDSCRRRQRSGSHVKRISQLYSMVRRHAGTGAEDTSKKKLIPPLFRRIERLAQATYENASKLDDPLAREALKDELMRTDVRALHGNIMRIRTHRLRIQEHLDKAWDDTLDVKSRKSHCRCLERILLPKFSGQEGLAVDPLALRDAYKRVYRELKPLFRKHAYRTLSSRTSALKKAFPSLATMTSQELGGILDMTPSNAAMKILSMWLLQTEIASVSPETIRKHLRRPRKDQPYMKAARSLRDARRKTTS